MDTLKQAKRQLPFGAGRAPVLGPGSNSAEGATKHKLTSCEEVARRVAIVPGSPRPNGHSLVALDNMHK